MLPPVALTVLFLAQALPLHGPDEAAALRRLAPEALAEKVDGYGREELPSILAALDTPEPAFGFVALRLGRLEAHRHRPRDARLFLRQAAGVPATAEAARVLLDRLEARRRVRPNRIGILLPLSGPYASIGKAALAAIKLALADHPRIKVSIGDTAGDADRAVQVVDDLVHIKGVAAIIGPIGTFESRAAAGAAERLQVPIMTLSAAEGLTRAGTFVFRHRLTRSAQAGAVARYACDKMGLRRFAILYPNSDYGRDMMRGFWRAVEQLGGEVRGAEAYGVHATNFNDPIKRLVGRFHLDARQRDSYWEGLNRKAKDESLHVPPIVDFDAIFVPDIGRRARLVLPFLTYWDIELKSAADLDASVFAHKYGGHTPQLVQVLGGSGFNNPRFAQRVGKPGHNAVFVDGFIPDSLAAEAFVADWTSKHQRPPPPLAAHAFDATHIVAKAVLGRGDRAEVRRALLAVRDHEGLFGPATVSGDGEVRFDLHVLTIDPFAGVVPRTVESGDATYDEDNP